MKLETCPVVVIAILVSLSSSAAQIENTGTVLDLGVHAAEVITAAPEGFRLASYSVGAIPSSKHEEENRGMHVLAQQGEGIVIYGFPVEVGQGMVRISCSFYCEQDSVRLSVA